MCGFFGLLNVGIFGSQKGLVSGSQTNFKQIGLQLMGSCALALWAATTSYIYFKTVQALGRLRVSKFYEVVGIDIVMHTMSDQIGGSDDFDRDSRLQQYQTELNKQRAKKYIESQSQRSNSEQGSDNDESGINKNGMHPTSEQDYYAQVLAG